MEAIVLVAMWFVGLLGIFLVFMKLWIASERRHRGR